MTSKTLAANPLYNGTPLAVLPESLIDRLCLCLAFCAWETHLTGQVVATDVAQMSGAPSYEKAILAGHGAEAAKQYEEAYQEARRLIADRGLDFDDLLPETDRAQITV